MHLVRIIFTLYLFAFCLICNAQGQSEEIDSLKQYAMSLENNANKVESLLKISYLYRRSNSDSSLDYSTRALVLAREIHDQEGISNSYYNMSLAYKYQGDFTNALIFGELYYEASINSGDQSSLAKSLLNLGNIKRNTSDISEAPEYYKKALSIYKSQKDSSRILAVYNSLGIYFKETGNYDSAAIYYHKALELTELLGQEEYMGRLLSNLGNIYYMQMDIENSRKYYFKSLEFNYKYNDLLNIAYTYSKLGSLSLEENDPENALIFFNRADSLFHKVNNHEGIYNGQTNYGCVYRELGDYKKAFEYFFSSLAYYRNQDISEGLIASWQGIASVYALIDQYRKALVYYDSSLNLARKTHNTLRQQEVLKAQFNIHLKRKSYQNAVETQIILDSLEKKIYVAEKDEVIADLRMKYEREHDQLQIAHLEKEKLIKTKQINLAIYIFSGILLVSTALIFFLRYRSRKNRIISQQKIRQLEEEKKFLSARFIVEGQEKERIRLATAIRDSLGLMLSASKMHVSSIRDSNPENRELIEKATKYLDDASEEIRKISQNIMSDLHMHKGLFEALEILFVKINDSEKLDARMEVVGPKDEELPENFELMIYRIVQEMVSNTLQHSRAGRIDLTIIVHPDQFDISYADDGIGFNLDEIPDENSPGLQNIISRVNFLEGRISIKSEKGKGCKCIVNIPRI